MMFVDVIRAALSGRKDGAVGVVMVDPADGEALGTASKPLQSEGALRSTEGVSFSADGAKAIAYNADGTIDYIEITDGATTYRQTWTWTSGTVTAVTGWVAQ